MTNLLKDLLRDDYLDVLRVRMFERGHNNTSLARATDFTPAHIGNILKGGGSDDALKAVCLVLGLNVTELLKDEYQGYAAEPRDTDKAVGE